MSVRCREIDFVDALRYTPRPFGHPSREGNGTGKKYDIIKTWLFYNQSQIRGGGWMIVFPSKEGWRGATGCVGSE